MITCARCGLEEGDSAGKCQAAFDDKYDPGDNRVACRDRELRCIYIAGLLGQVLEALS